MGFRKLPWEKHCLVWVQHDDGRWCEGSLEAWREDRDGWRGWVRYSTGLGKNTVRRCQPWQVPDAVSIVLPPIDMKRAE